MEFSKTLILFLILLPFVAPSSLEREVEELKSIIVDVVTENTHIKEENAQLKVAMTALEERMEKMADIVSTLLPSQNVRQNDTEELEARVAALEETVADVEMTIGDVENDVEDQDDRINTLQVQILNNDGDIDALEDQFLALEDMTSQLNTDVTSLSLDVTLLGVDVTSLGVDVTSLGQDVTSMGVNVTSLDGRVTSLDGRVTSLDDRVTDLESGGGSNNADTIFLAALETDNPGSVNPVVFEREVLNSGGHYDPTTGYYTAPYDGIYMFHVQMMGFDSSNEFYVYVYVDGSLVHRDYDYQYLYRSATVLIEVGAGQLVHVYRGGGGATGDTLYLTSYFWGYMISAL